jgi:DNA-binding response OmpR family regulator
MTRISRVRGAGAYAELSASAAETSPLPINPCLLEGASEAPLGDTRSERSDSGLMNSESDDTEPPLSGERGDAPDVLLLPAELSVVVDGARVALTRTQFSIFTYFFENAGRWVTPNEWIRHVLGTHHQPDTSLVRVHVHAIRRRLGQGAVWLESDPRRVRGYRWGGPALAQSEVS